MVLFSLSILILLLVEYKFNSDSFKLELLSLIYKSFLNWGVNPTEIQYDEIHLFEKLLLFQKVDEYFLLKV